MPEDAPIAVEDDVLGLSQYGLEGILDGQVEDHHGDFTSVARAIAECPPFAKSLQETIKYLHDEDGHRGEDLQRRLSRLLSITQPELPTDSPQHAEADPKKKLV